MLSEDECYRMTDADARDSECKEITYDNTYTTADICVLQTGKW